MKTTQIIALALASIVITGCIQTSVPKTPNQRAVEEAAERDDALEQTRGRPAGVPPAIKR